MVRAPLDVIVRRRAATRRTQAGGVMVPRDVLAPVREDYLIQPRFETNFVMVSAKASERERGQSVIREEERGKREGEAERG